MKFRSVHKLTTYLLASTAVFALASSGILSTASLILFILAVGLSWHAEPETRIGDWFDRLGNLLNIVTLLLLVLAVFQVARSYPEIDLLPFLDFVLFLLALKLCQRRGNRDYLQVYILSFLIMLAAAWLATSVVFVIGFAIYVVLATWTLVLFHLRREIEENYIVRHSSEMRTEQVTATRVLNSRRVVGGTFFAVTGGIAMLVLLGSSLVFAIVPRVGIGFILGGVRRQVGIAGFTDEVKLGMHGAISTDNQTVVFRSQVPSIASITDEKTRDRTISSLYWRGTVYDTYEKGQWLRSRNDKGRTHLTPTQSGLDLSRAYLVADPFEIHRAVGRKAALYGTVEQVIEIVALSHPVAFAIDRPVMFEMPMSPPGSFTAIDFEPRWGDEVSLRAFRINPTNPYLGRQPMTEFLGARYRVYSRDTGRGNATRTSYTENQLLPGALDNYLRIPVSMTGRIPSLAKQIMANQQSSIAKVQAVTAWLRQTHSYTTNLKRNERIADPLEDFLFEQKAGHCEYFASSAAILLRLGGVPTRYVNGFLGGEWNDLRQAITVRENRAHSWIEAYLGSEGWVRVDATPPLSRTAYMGSFRQLVDAAELFWSRWIVEYSASQQLLLAQRLGQKLGFSGRGFLPGKGPARITRKQALLVTGGIVLAILLITQRKRWLQRRTRDKVVTGSHREQQPIIRLYRATQKRLASAGVPREPSETPHEYLARLNQSHLQGAAVFTRLTECYASARFGDIEIPPDVVAELRRDASQVGLVYDPGSPSTNGARMAK